jgi:hypothetical protein
MSIALVQLAGERAMELRRRIGPFDEPIVPEGASQTEMLQALRASELDMLVTLMFVPEAERPTACVFGDWTLNQTVGHLADWDSFYLDSLRELEGNSLGARHWPEDADEMSQLLMQMRSRVSFEQNWRDFRVNRIALIESLERMRPDRFLQATPGKRFETPYHLAWSALDHFLEHVTHARTELGMHLPDHLLSFKGPFST